MLFEKYRPKSFDEIVGQDEIIKRIKTNTEYIKQNMDKEITERHFVHFLFTGPPGTGKTTAARCIAKELFGGTIEDKFNGHYRDFNASDNRGIDDVRGPYKNLALAKGFRIIFLDEADNLTPDAQQALRNTMESTKTAIFILSGNRQHKIIDPIRSRCVIYKFQKIKEEDVFRYVVKIIKSEGIVVMPDNKETLNLLVKEAKGDLRQATNMLESLITPDKHLNNNKVYSEVKPVLVGDALRAALDGDAEQAYCFIRDAVINSRHDSTQLLEELYDSLGKLDKEKYDIEVIMRLYDKLAETERGCLIGGNPLFQLTGFICFAWIAPNLRKVKQ